MRIMSLDYGMANSGVCISEISDGKLTVLYSDVLLSDKTQDLIPRIVSLIVPIFEIYNKYKPDILIKEECFIGRASSAKGVLFAHAILELELYKKDIEIIDIHNATLKAFCKKYLIDNSFYTKEELKQFDKKQVIAEFLKCYFGDDVPNIYTKRGRLEDDKADSIALAVYYYEKNLK